MNLKLIAFMTLLFIVAIPTVYAQISIGEKATQTLVEVTINSSNEVHVKHVIASSNTPTQVDLIDGVRTNLKVSDENGKEKQVGIIGDGRSIMIYPSQKDTIVEYDLANVLFLKNNMMIWNFTYPETTSFITPEEVEMVFANNRPVHLDEQRGIRCHGCQMILEYSINMPEIFENVKLDDKELPVEVRTFAEINQFNFDQLTKSISFEVKGEKQFVTAIIPKELLPASYKVFLGDKKIPYEDYINNGTHVWLSIRPDNSGQVSITSVEISNDTTTNDDTAKINTNQDNTSKSNVNQNIMTYILIGVIVSIGIGVMLIIMRKKKTTSTRTIKDNKTENQID